MLQVHLPVYPGPAEKSQEHCSRTLAENGTPNHTKTIGFTLGKPSNCIQFYGLKVPSNSILQFSSVSYWNHWFDPLTQQTLHLPVLRCMRSMVIALSEACRRDGICGSNVGKTHKMKTRHFNPRDRGAHGPLIGSGIHSSSPNPVPALAFFSL